MLDIPSIKKYYDLNRYDQMTCTSIPYTDRAAVIIESRDHPMLRWTINNIIHYSKWPIILYHSKQNYHLIQDLNLYRTIELKVNFGLSDYNQLLISPEFWLSLPENILLFQTDSFMLRTGIERFMKYDYVGSPWSKLNMKIYSIATNIGNGGFSFRKRYKMLQIVEKVKYEQGVPEDLYFAKGFSLLGGNLPPLRIQKQFGVEQIFYKNPLAIHAPWHALDDNEMIKLLNL